MRLVLLLALGAVSCAGPSYREAQSTRDRLRSVAKQQLEGSQADQGPTGMWKVDCAGRVQRWLIVLDGDRLYVEPAVQYGAFAFDYYVGRKDTQKPRTWTLEHHVVTHAAINPGVVSPNVGTLSFDADHRVLQAEWPNIRTRSGGLLDRIQDAVDSTDIRAHGTRGPWPNL
jgi:hypothetical protein